MGSPVFSGLTNSGTGLRSLTMKNKSPELPFYKSGPTSPLGDAVKDFFRECGRFGGSISRKKLSSEEARRMARASVKARRAKAAARLA